MFEIDRNQVPAHWQQCLDELGRGENVVVTDGAITIAEIRPMPQPLRKPQPVGLGVGLCVIEPNCFDPLPDDLLAAFNGETASFDGLLPVPLDEQK